MTTPQSPRRLSLPERVLTRGFQKLWRLTRGHLLRAEALVWRGNSEVLVSPVGSLPGTLVRRGEAAEDALRKEFEIWAEKPLSLVAMALRSTPERPTRSTHSAVFELDWTRGQPLPAGYAFFEVATLEAVLPPELLTIIHRRAALRDVNLPM